MNVLVVDDDPETIELIKTFLENGGHAVTVSEDARGALQKLEQNQPHFMMLDIRLPDNDGLAVLKIVKSKYPKLPVVMMTGFKEAEFVVEAFRHGAIDCLLKPLNFEYLKLHIIPRIAS